MKKVARALALTSALLATPAGAISFYKLQLLVDIYTVLAQCASLDTSFEVLRESVLGELEAEGYTESQIAVFMSHDAFGTLNYAECAASLRPLMSAYLATPE